MSLFNTEYAHPLLNTEYARDSIVRLMKKSAESFFEIGTILKDLKEEYESYEEKSNQLQGESEYNALLEGLPFGTVVANKLIQIAKNQAIGENLDIMPSSYNTMYSLVSEDAEYFAQLREKGMNAFTTAKSLSAMREELSNEGDTAEGDTAEGDTAEGDTAEGDTAEGDTAEGDIAEVDTSDNDASEGDTEEEGILNHLKFINITVDTSKLSAFEKSKLKDLFALIQKLNFSEDKGVAVDGANPDILSDNNLDIAA
jgi:hypothetical protein